MTTMQRFWFSLICLCPIAVAIASLITGSINPSDRRNGLGLVIVGLLWGVFNLYLALRPALYLRKRGSLEGFRYSSGTPLGSFFTVLGIILGFAHLPTAIVGLLAMLIDINGLPWGFVLINRQHDESIENCDSHRE